MNIKKRQENAVLNYLFTNRSASRTQISRGLGIRQGTTGKICDDLLRGGHIRQKDSDRQRNVGLSVNPEMYMAVGAEHMHDGLLAVALSADLSVRSELHAKIPKSLTGKARLRKIIGEIRQWLEKQGPRNAPVGLGFCDIGMFDAMSGRSIRAAFLPDWNNIPLRQHLEKGLDIPVSLMGKTDSRCAAEHVFGTAAEWDTFVYVMVDRGIGLSLMSEGSLIKGNHPIYGELGHVVFDPAGKHCECGGRGCLETIAGASAIVEKVQAQMNAADAREFCMEQNSLTIEKVVQAAHNGFKPAESALYDAGWSLGFSLAGILSVLGITNIVLSGRVAGAGKVFMDPLRTALHQYCVYPLNRALDIKSGEWHESDGARGAAYRVLENHFQAGAGGCPSCKQYIRNGRL